MRDGAIVQLGTPEEIYHRPVDRYVAEFIGDPPINVVPCTVERSGALLIARSALHSGLALGRSGVDAGEHWLAVRPHDITAMRQPAAGTASVAVRFVENFGAEHVLHVQYGEELVRVVVPPHFAAEGDLVHIALDPRRLHLIERASERIVRFERLEAAA
jgi:ABC-type sugar transport system ATPase subunit